MRHSEVKEYLGVDVGSVRVGVARGSSAAKIAEPLTTLPAASAVDALAELAAKHGAAAIVVGLPRGLDGQETPQTKYVRAWAAAARAKISLSFYWQDEALTTRAAQGAAGKEGLDARAAAVILQDFLDTPKEGRVRCLE